MRADEWFSDEMLVELKGWRKNHKFKWWYEKRFEPFLWKIVGLFYRHKSLELESGQHYYKYPPDYLFRWDDFLKDGELHLCYFPRWWGECKRGFLVP